MFNLVRVHAIISDIRFVAGDVKCQVGSLEGELWYIFEKSFSSHLIMVIPQNPAD